MADYETPSKRSTATLLRIVDVMEAYQAALIADDHARADTLRQEAHALLDAYFELSGEAALGVRAILPR